MNTSQKMYKKRSLGDIQKQNNDTCPKICNVPITLQSDIDGDEVPDKQFKKLMIKMISELKADLRNKQ